MDREELTKWCFTTADCSITSSLCVSQQLLCMRFDAVQAQLHLYQLIQGMFVVLQLLLDPWGEALKRARGI